MAAWEEENDTSDLGREMFSRSQWRATLIQPAGSKRRGMPRCVWAHTRAMASARHGVRSLAPRNWSRSASAVCRRPAPSVCTAFHSARQLPT